APSEDRRMFKELARLHPLLKRRRVEKIIIHPVPFARARWTGCARDNAGHVWIRRQQLLAERRLAPARRRGNHDQQRTGPAPGPRLSSFGVHHSTFCTCSRNFSNSAFNVTTSREIRLSFAFEPIVFTSRFISCARKSSVRPTGSFDFTQSSNCWKWLSSRVSSSEISERSAK